MRAILVDDEPWAMKEFEIACENNPFIDVLGTFSKPSQALEFAKYNDIDFALLDIEMPEMSGLELSEKLREIRPDIVIIFVTAHSKYVMEALKKRADYFVTKPYVVEDIEDTLSRAMLLSKRQTKRIVVRTFGSFDVFLDGKPLIFKSAKAKEVLALLVDRHGGIVTTTEAFFQIWEDEGYSDNRLNLCRKAFQKLGKVLEGAGIPELVITQQDGRMINMDVCDCDYFRFLDGDIDAINDFNDEYMSSYSWGEETLAKLSSLKSGGY